MNKSKIDILIEKYLLNEKKYWSADVETHWTPPEGLFTKSAETIVDALKKAPGGLSKAMARLNFYINRAGRNLTRKRKKELKKAKEMVSKLTKSEED